MAEIAEEQELEGQSEEQEQEQPPIADPEVEKRARLMGWMPKENFKGDPERWQPADAFVKRADELMPIMKTQLRKYEDRISRQDTELSEVRKTLERIAKTSEKAMERAYEQAKSDIIKKQAAAVAAGDTETWANLEQEKDKLEKPEKIEVKPTETRPNEENPMFKSWHQENEWYLTDPAMTRYANAYAQENANAGIPYTQWLEMIEGAVKEAFPHKFNNPARKTPAPVDAGSNRGNLPGRPKAKTYNDLPAEAKTICDRQVRDGLFKSREDYVKIFFEEGE